MDDDDRDNQPPAASTAIARVRHLARRGGRRLRGALRERVDEVTDRLRQRVVRLLGSPQQVRSLQKVLANMANWTLRRGFRADPNAELLFEFVDWLDDRHDRRRITSILLHSPLLRDPALIDALAHLSDIVTPWETPASDSHWDVSRLERFKRRTGDRLLSVLVELAALEHDTDPPAGNVDERIAYFEQAPIPERFGRLAAMTQGRLLMTRRLPSRRLQTAKGLVDRLRPHRAERSAMVPFLPGTGDERLQFLVLSTTFFIQSYLLRNLIEALPEIAAELHEKLELDETIDLD